MYFIVRLYLDSNYLTYSNHQVLPITTLMNVSFLSHQKIPTTVRFDVQCQKSMFLYFFLLEELRTQKASARLFTKQFAMEQHRKIFQYKVLKISGSHESKIRVEIAFRHHQVLNGFWSQILSPPARSDSIILYTQKNRFTSIDTIGQARRLTLSVGVQSSGKLAFSSPQRIFASAFIALIPQLFSVTESLVDRSFSPFSPGIANKSFFISSFVAQARIKGKLEPPPIA